MNTAKVIRWQQRFAINYGYIIGVPSRPTVLGVALFEPKKKVYLTG